MIEDNDQEKIDIDRDEYIKPLILWETLEVHRLEKGTSWYFGIVIFFIVLISYFLATAQWSATLVFLVLAYVIFTTSAKKTELTHCEITKVGVGFNDRFYSYTDLKSFAIHYDNPRRLQLFSNKPSLYVINVPITDEVDPIKLRRILSNHIPEQAVQDDFFDKLARIIKL